MPPADIIETTVAEVTGELLRRGVGPDEPVSIIIEPVEGLALARRKSRVRVVAAGLTDDDIDRLIKQAQKEVEPNLAEAIRRRFAPLGGVDLEPASMGLSTQRLRWIRRRRRRERPVLVRHCCTSHRRFSLSTPPFPTVSDSFL
jgi:hypothetical protein